MKDRLDPIVREVTDFTRPFTDSGLVVALYLYGSCASGEVDRWSDADFVLVYEPSDEGLACYRSWLTYVCETYRFEADGIGFSTDELDANSTWLKATFQAGLVRNSQLLLGEDVKSRIAFPSKDELMRNLTRLALVRLRGLYRISDDGPIPERLEVLDASQVDEQPYGSPAWLVYSTVVNLLRAIMFTQSDRYHASKQSLRREVENSGDSLLATSSADAAALRQVSPRFGPLDRTYSELPRMLSAIPALYEKLLSSTLTSGGSRDA